MALLSRLRFMRLTVKSKNTGVNAYSRQNGTGPFASLFSAPWPEIRPLVAASLVYFFFFLGHGSYFTTLSPHMLYRFGDDARYVFFTGQLLYPFGYFFAGWFSDKTRRIRSALVAFLLLQTPFQYHLFSPDLSLMGCIVSAAVTRFFFAANTQLLTIAALESLSFRGFSVSRSAGTFGFFCIQIGMLLLEMFALSDAAPEIQGGRGGQWGSVFMLVTALFAYLVPERRRSHTEYFFRDAFSALKKEGFLPFFIVSFVFYFSYQVVDYYLGGYLRQAGGMSYVYGGWGLAVLVEIPLMILADRIAGRRGVRFLFLLAVMSGAIRFLILGLDAVIGLPGLILFQQLLHGIHFTGYYMGTVYLLRRNFPEHLYGTGMGIYMVVSVSAGATIGNLLTGMLLKSDSGFAGIFFVSLLLHLAVFFSFLFLSLPARSMKKEDSAHV